MAKPENRRAFFKNLNNSAKNICHVRWIPQTKCSCTTYKSLTHGKQNRLLQILPPVSFNIQTLNLVLTKHALPANYKNSKKSHDIPTKILRKDNYFWLLYTKRHWLLQRWSRSLCISFFSDAPKGPFRLNWLQHFCGNIFLKMFWVWFSSSATKLMITTWWWCSCYIFGLRKKCYVFGRFGELPSRNKFECLLSAGARLAPRSGCLEK